MAERIPTGVTIQRVLSPEDWKDKQIGTLKAVGRRNYLVGIGYPKRSPIGAGKSDWAEEKFNAKMMIALENKTRQKAVGKSSDEEWFKYSKEIGADALITGVVKREAKVADFVTAWQPKLVTHLADVDAMGVATLEERIEKAAENIRGLAALHGAAKGI